MVESKFSRMKTGFPANTPRDPRANTTSSPPRSRWRNRKNNKNENPPPPLTLARPPANPVINAPPCSPSPAKHFAAAATTSTGFEIKLIQAFSKEIKGNQSNSNQKNIADPMTGSATWIRKSKN